jgi:hypothetical protein
MNSHITKNILQNSLFAKLSDNKEVSLRASNGLVYTGKVIEIKKEDGGDRCYNVTLQQPNENKTFFVRTFD